MSDSAQPSGRRFVSMQLLALTVSSAGWLVWLEAFYRYGATYHSGWLAAAAMIAALSQGREGIVRLNMDQVGSALLALTGIAAAALLEWPWRGFGIVLRVG